MSSTALNAARRSAELQSVASETLDLIVIGGGITGAGVALDAASRGLSVALVERHDLASGTSSWSSKLVHGGLRYLASGAVGIAYESAYERRILLERTAPHLVRALPLVIPLTPTVSSSEARVVAIGGRMGDGLRIAARTKRATLPSSTRWTPAKVAEHLPRVRAEGLRGGLVTFDGQLEDDARLVIGIARTAAGHGARILTRLAATAVSGTAVTCTDELTGASITLNARHVINATGVWASSLEPSIRMRPSKGVHIVLDAARLGNPTAALAVPVPGERARYVFALPQRDATVLVGLTDDSFDGPIPDAPPVLADEVGFLVDILNQGLDEPLTPADVIGSFAGLRPLIDSADGSTADLSRKHQVIEGVDGVLTIVGGKLTTYRRMAQDAVDTVVARGQKAQDCRTRNLPLIGAGPTRSGDRARLVRRYGSEASVVEGLIEATPRLAQQVSPQVPSLLAEFAYGISHEGALLPEDLVARRCRLDFVDAWKAAALPVAEQLLAEAHQA